MKKKYLNIIIIIYVMLIIKKNYNDNIFLKNISSFFVEKNCSDYLEKWKCLKNYLKC